ncbi:hypothetical protein DUNSADRAFT_7500 [Dunaliella salina]|uniref:Uncharacterized protein n=1 Tax=Dunaliella salina TaxID=3046 RepID=A0ABQ7GLD0_DUNSA|nr:hypothetical protein DUNSADRAFT_7500 [Dunaliella salina]|eukprot:KAF5835373.1 hypothetical protein DUNSADRAFT_7500 [Dunaliella salina]
MADEPSLGTLDWDDDGTTANDLTNAAAPDPPANTNNKEDDDVDVNVESLLPKRRERDEEAQAPPAAPALHQQGPAEAQENLGDVDWDEDAPVQQHEQQQEQQQQQQEHWWGGEDVTGATQEAAVNDGHEPTAQEHAGPEGGPDFAKPAARPPPKQAFDVPTSGAFW